MAKIDPNTLYSVKDLEDLLEDLMSVEAFLRTIEPRRPFKKCFWGKHLIEALDSCGKDVRGNLHRDFGRGVGSKESKRRRKLKIKGKDGESDCQKSGFTLAELGIKS